MALETISSVDFHWSEVLDVLWIKEHISSDALLLVALQWVSGEDDPLQDDLERVGWHDAACRRHDIDTIRFDRVLSEAEHFARCENDWTDGCSHGWHVTSHKAHELQLL